MALVYWYRNQVMESYLMYLNNLPENIG